MRKRELRDDRARRRPSSPATRSGPCRPSAAAGAGTSRKRPFGERIAKPSSRNLNSEASRPAPLAARASSRRSFSPRRASISSRRRRRSSTDARDRSISSMMRAAARSPAPRGPGRPCAAPPARPRPSRAASAAAAAPARRRRRRGRPGASAARACARAAPHDRRPPRASASPAGRRRAPHQRRLRRLPPLVSAFTLPGPCPPRHRMQPQARGPRDRAGTCAAARRTGRAPARPRRCR